MRCSVVLIFVNFAAVNFLHWLTGETVLLPNLFLSGTTETTKGHCGDRFCLGERNILFDVVALFGQGLLPMAVEGYLAQIGDALIFVYVDHLNAPILDHEIEPALD